MTEPAQQQPAPWDSRGERAWKWMLRGAGLAAFSYVLIAMGGDVALGAYIIIGGLIGLPNVLSLQQLINARTGGDGS